MVGMHQRIGISPDAALWKTISSGIPFSVLVGTDDFFSGINNTFHVLCILDRELRALLPVLQLYDLYIECSLISI